MALQTNRKECSYKDFYDKHNVILVKGAHHDPLELGMTGAGT